MKRYWTLTLLVWGLLFSTRAVAEVHYITTEQFRSRVFDYTTDTVWQYRGKQPCVIDFYTTWCGPCKRLAPIMDTLSNKYKGKVVFYKADTEKERELAYVFQIASIPQVLYVPKSGKPMLLKGLYPRQNIEQIIDEFLLGKKPKKQ
ncbi:MAG: thioredoxin fold domain-containing protein [Paludibacteraceae bacterium]|nr:thioredoxin fold domain-containing protein [Paludibacteraceae bacterium]